MLRTMFFFCFQETFITDPGVFRAFFKAWRGPFFWSPAVGKRAGVLTCFSGSFSLIISLVFQLDLINIYAPTNLTERKVFFDNLQGYFLPSDVVIIADEYNCYDHQLDKFGENLYPAKYLCVFCSTFSLSDAWRKLHPRLRQCTWFNSDFSIGSRLDKFFVSQRFMPSVSSCEIRNFSDHAFVYISIHSSGNKITTCIDDLSGCLQTLSFS